MILRALQRFLVCMCAAGLGACAMPRTIDSDVQSFTGSEQPASNADFRFERLPSQQHSNPDLQDALEGMAQVALERVGLQRNDTAGRNLAQLSVGVDTIRNPYYRPPRPRWVRGSDGRLYEEWPMLPDIELPWFRHRLHLTLRDSSTSQVAYETTAVFDGPWRDTLNLVPPMLEAALKDYPHPGKRRVVVQLPAPGKETP